MPTPSSPVFSRRCGNASDFNDGFSFAGPDGSTPNAGLTLGAGDNLYGTTFGGGAVNQSGTIFKINGAGVLTSIYSFSGPDGSGPYGALTPGSDGNFYGSTDGGGTNSLGTVFKITPAGVLYERDRDRPANAARER